MRRFLEIGILAATLSYSSFTTANAQDDWAQERALLPAPVVIALGGYGTCDYVQGQVSPFGSDFGRAGTAMVNELHSYFNAPNVNWRGMNEAGIHWLFSCFNSNGELYMQSSRSGTVNYVGIPNPDYVLAEIEALSDWYRRPVFIIGYSHGGWLAMRVAEYARQSFNNGFLATIDPISYVHCNAATYADALLMTASGGVGGAWGSLNSCRQAPQDFSPTSVARIRANIGNGSWKHYWQTNFIPLHSSDIPNGPHASFDLSPYLQVWPGGTAAAFNAHVRISNLSSIWHSLKTGILHTYGAAY